MPNVNRTNSLILHRDNKNDMVKFTMDFNEKRQTGELTIARGTDRDELRVKAQAVMSMASIEAFCDDAEGTDGPGFSTEANGITFDPSANPAYTLAIRSGSKIIVMLDERQSEALHRWINYLSLKI